ncbi:MAG: hypothetical protein JWO86_433 [Myxococcaceae bacterium]|nr:hypothetical protein [Myxococcaceae bacterium]
MKRTGRRILSAVPALAAVAACIIVIVAQDACVLAQPSGELPRIPETRPTILHASTVPSETSVLTRWPLDSVFVVPVELADPTVRVTYAAFIDFDLLTGDGLVDQPGHSDFAQANTTGRIRTLSVAIPEPDPGRCHKVEIVVALRLVSEFDQKQSHTPDEPGGDISTWFYNPSGDLAGCPALDAGIDASFDADADVGAGEGGN